MYTEFVEKEVNEDGINKHRSRNCLDWIRLSHGQKNYADRGGHPTLHIFTKNVSEIDIIPESE